MKKLVIIFIMFVSFSFLNAQEFDRNILIEVFTNSHCPLCPPAHSAVDSYLSTGSEKDRVSYIYYHMVFPYSDDQLNKDNPTDAAARNNYYGPFGSTPVGFFDGATQSGGYSSWGSKIDTRLAVKSPMQINLNGTKESGSFTVNAELNIVTSISGNNVIHFVVVEDVNYSGRNGVNPHKHVMRKMVTPPTGESINLSSSQTINKTVSLNSLWNTSNLGIVVFVQNSTTKEVYQSEFITYNELGVTGIEDENNLVPASYSLSQNYPNPFNPSTTIEYEIPKEEHVVLKVYNVLGSEVAELVNSNKSAGNYKINFNGKNLASGVYYYIIRAGEFFESRKFVLLK